MYIDADDETMTERLVNRGKTSGRVDDNLETIKSRLQTFHGQTKPVIDHYEKENKVKRVASNSSSTPDAVFAEVVKIFDSVGKFSKINDKHFEKKDEFFVVVKN